MTTALSVEWMTRDELAQVARAVEGSWNRPLPEDEVHRALAWFPDLALIDWFLRGDGFSSGGVTGLSLKDALSWRRQLLLRDLPSPLSSADQFLPLIRCDAGFLIYDGKARGVALRRTQQPERYARALESALGLRALLGELEPAQEVPQYTYEEDELEDDEEEEAEEEQEVSHHLERIARHHGWAPATTLDASTLWGDAVLVAWFSRVGAKRQQVLGDLSALSLHEALVLRDELEERASPELRARLHHLRWVPLIELPGRHVLLAWQGHGVQLHVFHEGAWQAASWVRRRTPEAFFRALSAWCEPREAPAPEDGGAVAVQLFGVASEFDLDAPERDVATERLAGFSAPTANALAAWFSVAPEQPFREANHRLASVDALEAGHVIAPLLVADDGVELSAVEGSGVVLRVGDARLPWAVGVTDWARGLAEAARARVLPGVAVTRNFLGKYRVELPMLPFEVARRLEQVRAGEPWVVLRNELSVALGEVTRLEVPDVRPVFVLDEAGRAELISALDAQRDAELEWEPLSTTFVFKPLR